MGTSSFMWSVWFLPHNVFPNAQNAGSAGKRTQPGVHCQNGPQFNMAVRITSEHTYAQNAQARIWAAHVIGLLHTEVVLHTSQSLHAIWCSPTRPHRDCVGIGHAMAVERWVLANEISIFSYVEISALLTYENLEFARTQISLRNELGTTFACRHLRLTCVYRCQACEALICLMNSSYFYQLIHAYLSTCTYIIHHRVLYIKGTLLKYLSFSLSLFHFLSWFACKMKEQSIVKTFIKIMQN